MNIEREVKVRDTIRYCIENFDSQTATNRIVEFWKDELKLQQQQCNIANVVGRSEQLSCNTCKFYPVDYDPYCATCKNFEKHEKAT